MKAEESHSIPSTEVPSPPPSPPHPLRVSHTVMRFREPPPVPSPPPRSKSTGFLNVRDSSSLFLTTSPMAFEEGNPVEVQADELPKRLVLARPNMRDLVKSLSVEEEVETGDPLPRVSVTPPSSPEDTSIPFLCGVSRSVPSSPLMSRRLRDVLSSPLK